MSPDTLSAMFPAVQSVLAALQHALLISGAALRRAVTAWG